MEWKLSQSPVAYEDALHFMDNRVAEISKGKADECIWLLEHPSLYTAGTSAKSSDLLHQNTFPVYQSGRGGQYTYHGYGQRIAYVMLDLHQWKTDLRWYVAQLEAWIIATLGEFGIKGERRIGRVGIWVAHEGREDKVAAIGVRVRRWVTFHGLAINLNPTLSHFDGIIPCGIREHGVTSLHALGKTDVTYAELDAALQKAFSQVFLAGRES